MLPVEMAKSVGLVPAIVMPVMFSVVLPEFASVALCAALVVPEALLNVNVAGVNAATGAAATAALKFAVTLSGAFMVTDVDALLAEATSPVQFENEKPASGVAVRLTTVPGG